MRRRSVVAALLTATLTVSGCVDRAPSWLQSRSARYDSQIALPAPVTDGPISLEQALQRRRSVRTFRPDPVPLATIGELLWAGQGITSADGKRTAPSAGALYPVELYAVTPSRLMHYLPDGHRAELRAEPDLRPALQAAASGQDAVGAAPLLIVVAAASDRTRRKYGARAEAYVEREVGHVAQNILLEATARGLGAVPIGAVDPSQAAMVLALPPDQTVRYLIPVGVPA